jgi:hypothetical protein
LSWRKLLRDLELSRTQVLLFVEFLIYFYIYNFSGGKASDTKRGTNLKQFIRRDTVKAEIQIHLWNGGEDAYKTNVYGDRIIFERIIPANGSAVQNIKDHLGNTVHTGSKSENVFTF